MKKMLSIYVHTHNRLLYINTNRLVFRLRNKEILPFLATCMNQEDITLSEISRERKTNTAKSHVYTESKTVKLIEANSRMVVARGCKGHSQVLLYNLSLLRQFLSPFELFRSEEMVVLCFCSSEKYY